MRAKEFPRLLFEAIHRRVGSPPTETWPGYPKWEYFNLSRGKKEPFGHIGLAENLDTKSGLVSRLGVWGYTMLEPGTDEDLSPLLSIRGGPLQAGPWAMGRGKLLTEKVIVSTRSDFSYGGKDLKLPVIKLVAEVLDLAYQLQSESPSPSLSYWESFRHPERNYRRPR